MRLQAQYMFHPQASTDAEAMNSPAYLPKNVKPTSVSW